MQSNRPSNFSRFLDRLEETTQDPAALEVIVKIDDTDVAMNAHLPLEVARRPFRLKYISTPLPDGFYGLWRSMNDMLRICDPGAYFILNLNDEMFFQTRAWDVALRRYVGLFKDDIFRLRTSFHRSRNYFDFWEAGYVNDTSAIMTKRWIDIGGNWCPCNGPDSFQQCVAYYFGWLHRFEVPATDIYRDIAIHDIAFGGAGSNSELKSRALYERLRGSRRAWYILMSHAMQEEAARRAQQLHAHIWAERDAAATYLVKDNRRARRVDVLHSQSGDVARSFPYALSWMRISLINFFRSANYGWYGHPKDGDFRWFRTLVWYLCVKYETMDVVLEAYAEWHLARPEGRTRAYYLVRGAIRFAMRALPTIRRLQRLRDALAYQVRLLRLIYLDPNTPIPSRRPWKYVLYRNLVLVFAIWPKQIMKKARHWLA